MKKNILLKQFSSLSHEAKFAELKILFSQLTGKNAHCTYIHEKIESSPELFNDELMMSIYEEAIRIKERTDSERLDIGLTDMQVIQQRIQEIHRKELSESENADNILELL